MLERHLFGNETGIRVRRKRRGGGGLQLYCSIVLVVSTPEKGAGIDTIHGYPKDSDTLALRRFCRRLRRMLQMYSMLLTKRAVIYVVCTALSYMEQESDTSGLNSRSHQVDSRVDESLN